MPKGLEGTFPPWDGSEEQGMGELDLGFRANLWGCQLMDIPRVPMHYVTVQQRARRVKE